MQSKRNWEEYNERAVRRGEVYISLDFLDSWDDELAKKQGLLGFTAEVLADNYPMLHLFSIMGFEMEKRLEDGVYHLKMRFR